MPYNHKLNVLRASLNKTFPSFLFLMRNKDTYITRPLKANMYIEELEFVLDFVHFSQVF